MTCGKTSIARVICLGVLVGAMAWAQTEEAGMTGIVKNPSGGPVASDLSGSLWRAESNGVLSHGSSHCDGAG